MQTRIKILVQILFFLFVTITTKAQDTLNYDAMSLSDLMNIKIKVASVKGLSAAESPGIITVITGEEVRASGARDLMDVLETVPGFDFGMDVEGVVGLGVRGNWAHEGKALLLIDGQVMNEGLYSTLQFGNHYPLTNIKRIEIIRGPGSVIYGDYAEYTVINIITQTPAEINGVGASLIYGQMKESFARKGGTFCAGKAFRDFEFDIKGSYLEGNRSDDIYRDAFGYSYDLTSQSQLNNSFLNIGMRYKNLSIRAISDIYMNSSADEYQQISDKPYIHKFNSYFTELKHQLEISDKYHLVTWLTFKQQSPWNVKSANEESHKFYDITNQRYTANSQLQWDPTVNINFTFGIEAFHDYSKDNAPDAVFSSTQKNTLIYNNTAFYGQFLWKNKIATLTMGVRQNYNSNYQSNFVPRFGITRSIGAFHFKALYSVAYRAPGAENIDLGSDIKPEKTAIMEFEAGCQINKHLYFVVNAYDIETKSPIIYYYDTVVNNDAYVNKNSTGTQGIETELKYKNHRTQIRTGYALYSAANKEVLDEYAVPGKAASLLGLPNHKAYFVISTNVSRNLNITAEAIVRGKRYFIKSLNTASEPIYSSEARNFRINVNAEVPHFLHQNISLSVGIYNLFDLKEFYMQPYNSLHAPLPGTGREIMIKISYRWNDPQK